MVQYCTLSVVKRCLFKTLIIAVIIEIICYPTTYNLMVTLSCLYGWWLLNRFVLTSKVLKIYPISFLVLFGLGIFYYYTPVIVTLLEFKPVTFTFLVPFDTAIHHFLFITMVVVSFCVYTKLIGTRNIFRHILLKLGYFPPPTDRQIWVLGILGLLGMIYQRGVQGADFSAASAGWFYRLIVGITPFAAAPVCLLMKKIYSNEPIEVSPKTKKAVYFHIIVAFILGISSGSRSLMISFFCVLFLIFFLYVLINNIRITSFFSSRKIICLFVFFYMVTGPLSDLALAMVINRKAGKEQTALQYIESTFDIFLNKELLYKLKMEFDNQNNTIITDKMAWDEYYVDNVFLARFSNLKIWDQTMHHAERVGFDNYKMKNFFGERIISYLPTPLINLLGINFNKYDAVDCSSGDLLYGLSEGGYVPVRGYRVTSHVGMGLATFGYKFYIISFGVYILLFYMLDSLCFIFQRRKKIIVSLGTLVLFYQLFIFFTNGEGLVRDLGFMFRGYIQNIVIYLILFGFIRKFF